MDWENGHEQPKNKQYLYNRSGLVRINPERGVHLVDGDGRGRPADSGDRHLQLALVVPVLTVRVIREANQL